MDVLTLSCSCWKTTGDATDVLRGEYYQVFLFQTIQHTQNISLLCACIHVQSKSDKMLMGESRSCLENPRDGGAWWAAGCGVAQSRTRLKRLSSSRGMILGSFCIRLEPSLSSLIFKMGSRNISLTESFED